MEKVVRISTCVSDVVDVKAEDYWYSLVDRWEDYKEWLTIGGQELAVLYSKLAPSAVPGAFPRTRIVAMDNPDEPFGLHFLNETLIYANHDTMTIMYRVDGFGNFSMRNYIAVQTIDELGPGKCRITISSHFDALPEYAEKNESGTKWFHGEIIHRGAANSALIVEKYKNKK